MLKFISVFTAVLCLAGCATNSARFVETQTVDPQTKQIVTTTTFSTKVQTTWGSKISEGAGDMAYQGSGKNPWKLDVGQAAKGVEAAGDPTQQLKDLIGVFSTVSSLFGKPAASPTISLEELPGK